MSIKAILHQGITASMISVNVTNQVRHDLKIYDNKKSTIEISTKILK